MKICPRCGNRLNDSAAICLVCGAALAASAATQQPPQAGQRGYGQQPQQMAQPGYGREPYPPYQQPQRAAQPGCGQEAALPKKNKSKIITIILAFFLLVIAVLYAGYFIYSRRNPAACDSSDVERLVLQIVNNNVSKIGVDSASVRFSLTAKETVSEDKSTGACSCRGVVEIEGNSRLRNIPITYQTTHHKDTSQIEVKLQSH
jgi:uncharacterized membrane protein YvbJ